MTPLICEMVKFAPDAELLHWFDASSISAGTMVNLNVVADTPLPYSRCAVVGFDGPAKWLLILGQEGNTVACAGWVLLHNKYEKHPPFSYVRTEDGRIMPFGIDAEKKVSEESMRGILATVGGWLQSLTPGQSAYKPEPRKSLINSKRRAKGLGPVLFDWHTVTIEPPKPKTGHQGGQHASPRMHDRRGHWRSLKTGKRVWVRDCKVGDASKGAVFKDYRIGTHKEGA